MLKRERMREREIVDRRDRRRVERERDMKRRKREGREI